MIQMRKADGKDSRFFSPNRDLAYCGASLIKRALSGFENGRQEPWIKEYIQEHNITEEELGNGAISLAEFLKQSMNPDNASPFEALTVSGFFNLNKHVQHILCAKMGQIFMSATFTSMREIINDSSEPELSTEQIAEKAVEGLDSIVDQETIADNKIKIKKRLSAAIERAKSR